MQQSTDPDPNLLETMAQLERSCGARICVAFEDLQTGGQFHYRADEKCKTASVIKFPMLVHVAMAVQEGSLSWQEQLVLTNEEKVPGSGVLTQLSAGLSLSIRDICVLMTIVSDNTGTNMMIERLGTETINARSRSLGLQVTNLNRKSYTQDTPESLPYGLGVTTASEMCHLVSLVARRASDGDAACAEVLQIMEAQVYRDGIPRFLPENWKYAGKTGAVDPVRNDVALVTSPDGRRFALAILVQELPVVQWTADNPGLLAIAELTKLLIPASNTSA